MGGPWIDLTVPVAPPFLMRQPAPLGAPTGMAHTEWCQISFAVERHGGTSAATYFNGCPGQAMTLRKGMQVDAKKCINVRILQLQINVRTLQLQTTLNTELWRLYSSVSHYELWIWVNWAGLSFATLFGAKEERKACKIVQVIIQWHLLVLYRGSIDFNCSGVSSLASSTSQVGSVFHAGHFNHQSLKPKGLIWEIQVPERGCELLANRHA